MASLQRIRRCLDDIQSVSEPETMLDRLEDSIRALVQLNDNNHAEEQEAISLLQTARECIQDAVDTASFHSNVSFLLTGRAGRPSFSLPRDKLQFLVEKGFSIPDIGAILGVSSRTVRRRLQQFSISITGQYSVFSDDELDATIRDILNEFPNCGFRRMDGFLKSKGLRVQQTRIRCSMRRVDPLGVLLRSLEINVISRRTYDIKTPMALWHIDGYHKLIR